MGKSIGVSLVVLALAMAVVPAYTDCLSQGNLLTLANGRTMPMKCHWAGVAEIAVAVPLIAVGIVMATNTRKGGLFSLGLIGAILGASAVMIPQDFLIGVCQTPTMLCHTLMRPLLTVLGSLTIVGSVGAMVLDLRAGRRSVYAADRISA